MRFDHSSTAAWLRSRLQYCDTRWEAAMARVGYRDEPTEEEPFTEEEWQMFCWADAWRDCFHVVEDELFRLPEVRAGLLLGLSARLPTTVYED